MNCWQLLRQMKALLEASEWADGAAEKVFGRVLVSAGAPGRGVGQLVLPIAVLTPLDAEADDETPELLNQRISLQIVTRGGADGHGETALLGGPRGRGQGASAGRGALEVEEAALLALRDLDADDGCQLRATWKGAAEAAEVEGLGFVATRQIRLEGWVTTARSYPPPTRMTASSSGAGQLAAAWSLPPNRYDTFGLVLRYAAGSTPPASPAAGTGIAVAAGAVSGSVSGLPAGPYALSLFRSYDETGSGSAERYSAAATATATVS